MVKFRSRWIANRESPGHTVVILGSLGTNTDASVMIATVERKRKIPGPNGQLVDATEIGFRGSGEYWNEYLADDGTVIRMKIVVTNIYRLDGQYDAEGQPVYVVKSNNVMAVSAPDELLGGDTT